VRTTARRVGDSWVISGRKQWISAATGWNGQGADLLTVVCRTDASVEPSRGISIIAVPRPDSGLILEHAFDTLGHRAHLMPRFRLDAVQVPAGNLLGQQGGGLQLAAESFAGSAGPRRHLWGSADERCFPVCPFVRQERAAWRHPRGHPTSGSRLCAGRCEDYDRGCAGAELACMPCVRHGCARRTRARHPRQGVRIGSSGAGHYRSYAGCRRRQLWHELPLAGLLQDAVALPLFAGGNIGVRRRQLHSLMFDPAYDDLATLDGICLAETVP
jgi:hypothetical protein